MIACFVNRIWIYSWIGDHTLSLSYLADCFARDVPEILLIKMSGLSANADGFSDFLNPPVWTVSAMLIVEIVIAGLLSYRKELFCKVICPLSIIIGLGIWNNAKNLRVGVWMGMASVGVMRVYVLTCISYYCYEFSMYLRRCPFTKIGIGLLSLIEACCVAVFLAIVMFARSGGRTYIWFAILLAFCACAISISGKGLSANLQRSNKITDYMGRLSLAVFLMHMPMVNLFHAYYPNNDIMYSHKFAFLTVVFALSVVFEFVTRYARKPCRQIAASVKRHIIHTGE